MIKNLLEAFLLIMKKLKEDIIFDAMQ